jgi:hypothetical protein
MAITKTIEIEAIAKDALKQIETLTNQVGDLEKQLKESNKTTKKVAKGIGTIGNAFKAAGVGLAIAAFAKLTEVFNENQKVTDAFNTAFEALSLAFNDFFNFLSSNVGTVIDYFKGIFDDPLQSISNFSSAIYDGVVKRLEQGLEALGLFGDAAIKFFSGDFAGAAFTAKEAAKELFDVVTGEDGGFEKITESVKTTVKGITDYAKSTVQAAKDTVQLNKSAAVGIAQNRIILEQKDREAEKLRQIRDDESKTIEERIAANNKLAEVLDEQEKLMLANADAVIAAAQAQFDKNGNDENYIALLEAKAEREGILAQIEGFRSEQLMNINSLEREKLDLLDEEKEKKEELREQNKQLREEERQGIKDNLDAITNAAGAETKIGRAVFIAKQAMLIKEQIAEAKATLQRIALRASEATVDTAKGAASTAKVGFPQNIPLLIAFAAQAAGIIASVKSAVKAAKGSASAMGGGGISGGRGEVAQAPAFNVVGAAPENQLAETIEGQQQKPIKAFVVSSEVSNQQALDRKVETGASIG